MPTPNDKSQLTEVEGIKARSNFLRGSLAESLLDPVTGAIAEDDTQLSKFHGIYQQDDRDIRAERARQKLEPAYSFMIRARIPGGICTSDQWLAMDRLATEYANQSLRITTRQVFQFHGVLKTHLKTTIQGINACLLDTIAACGDVNRNVMCSVFAEVSDFHNEACDWARRISEHLTPHTHAYHEIWLDGKKLADSKPEEEPIYGATYLPRKFKTAVAIPPVNDVDVLAHDLGFIAIEEDGALSGFNVSVGGGMGATHGEPETYPRLADVVGFCTPDQVLTVAEHVVGIQRDNGDRSNRKHARLKYTIDDRGLDWFTAELTERCGFALQPVRDHEFTTIGDTLGWRQGKNDLWYLTLYIPAGRVVDRGEHRLLTGLREIARLGSLEFRLTPNQNVMIAGLDEDQKEQVQALVDTYGLDLWSSATPLTRHGLACVALPTCGLAMAEAERYLPDLLARVQGLLDQHGLGQDDILLRITGCPNGCARPYMAEIGLVGKAPGRYNLMLGGSLTGIRLNALYRENAGEEEILGALDGVLADWARDRTPGEGLGDFIHRTDYLSSHS